jgi:hypothetical protein
MKMVKHPNIVQLLEVSSQQLLSLSLSLSLSLRGFSYIHAKLQLVFFFSFFEWCSEVWWSSSQIFKPLVQKLLFFVG